MVLEGNSTEPGTVQDIPSYMGTVTELFRDGQDCSGTAQCSSGTVQQWEITLPPMAGNRLQTRPKQSAYSSHIVRTWSHIVQVESLLFGQ